MTFHGQVKVEIVYLTLSEQKRTGNKLISVSKRGNKLISSDIRVIKHRGPLDKNLCTTIDHCLPLIFHSRQILAPGL